MTDAPSIRPPAEPEKLNLSTKLAFGVGDFGTAISANLLIWFQLIFFTDVVKLAPAAAGSIRALAGIWDAINDPAVGVLSDRYTTRWGRRYPWMFVGAIPLSLFFFLSWVIPQFSSDPVVQESRLFWFYVGVSVLFNTGYTAVNLPYTALTPELTQDYNERTSLNQYRFLFSLGGAILSLVIGFVIFATVKVNPAQQYLLLSGICTVFCLVAPYLCILGTRKRIAAIHQTQDAEDRASTMSFFQQFKYVLTNVPFLYVVGIYLFSWLAVQNTAAIVPYFVKYRMGLPDSIFPIVALTVQGTAIATLFLWNRICQRTGKKETYLMGMTLWIIAGVGLYFIEPGQIVWMYILAVLVGFGVSVAYLIPWSMLPDVIELDELKTGQRREGIFYGFITFLQKLGLALGQWFTSYILGQSGYNSDLATQPEPAVQAIRFLIGPIPAIALVFGLVLAALYPITREVHAEILLKLKQRKSLKQQPE